MVFSEEYYIYKDEKKRKGEKHDNRTLKAIMC